MLKRILSLMLCVCIFMTFATITVSAVTQITIYNVTLEKEPKAGEKPSKNASVPETASTYVEKVEWVGNFNDDGTFKAGEKYTVKVSLRIKDGQDKIVKFVSGKAKINGYEASKINISTDKKKIILGYTFTVGAAKKDAQDPNKAAFDELSLHEYEWEVLRLCNIERAKNGLNSLSMIGTLQDICDIREQELVTLFSHTRPNGDDCYSVIPSTFEEGYCGENIAACLYSPKEVVDAWMNSEGHRANILNPEFSYLGVGYNHNGGFWVQFFSDSKAITSIESSASGTAFSEAEIKDVYLTITASNGYVSHMPPDFDSMTKVGDKYFPRLKASSLPSFTKVEKAQENQPSAEQKEPEPEKETEAPKTTNPNEGKTSGIEAGSLFGKYIPITHAYATNFFVDYNLKAPVTKRFSIGTRFLNETTEMSPTFAESVKRPDYQNHYVKFNYLGTYGTIDEEIAVTQLGIITKEEYDKVMRGEESEWATAYNLTKDTIVISTEIYDANKNFVRKLSPACVIVATSADGSFITFSKYLGASATNLFSQIDNFFAPDEDKSRQTKSFSFEIDKLMLTSKADAEKLLPSKEKVNYEFLTYPELQGNAQYNTNHILDDDEFVTPENIYYQVGIESKTIDPVIKNEIKDVVSYSYYTHTIDTLYTQRNIVTSDGTLYGVTSKGEKKVIATNVKKATANHYLTNSGEVKELNGKVVATDVYDYEESNDGWIIGILKNDCSFYMGYTYIEGKDGYASGLAKILKNVKAVVPNGLITRDNTFYRWNNDISMTGYDPVAFASGEFVADWELNLGLDLVCKNAERVFPYEYLAKIWAHSDENKKQSMYGFVQASDGTLYGYSSTFHKSFNASGNGKVERIFPVFTSVQDGNFVGIKFENQSTIYVIASRYCDDNIYRFGPLVGGAAYVCETQGGYYGKDGMVYGLDDKPTKSQTKDGITPFMCTSNRITNNGNMYRKTATYRAYSRDTDSNIPLLPNVYTWFYDEHRITLLERTDGSVWMADILHPSTNADLIAMVGGYESSNVFQVSPATTGKVNAEFVKVKEMLSPTSSNLKFTDVQNDAWYATPVKWAVENGITNGTSATTFSPDSTCTRAQILTFLWRAVGSPKMEEANPFTDVKSTDYYYNAAIWAYTKGMVSKGTFDGDTPCTRSATVVYLWRNAGAPYTSYYGTFSDVTGASGYASAVSWAVNNGITLGTSETTFSPDTTCTRGQIVTFLLRALR